MSLLVDIEGIDGSGKGTQAALLCQRLNASGISAHVLSFPRYDQTMFGKTIGEFLNGQFGDLKQVHPFLVSLLFAGDRFESRRLLHDALLQDQVLILDRYVPSNIAHQGAKCTGTTREDLIRRVLYLEYELYQLPRPDLVLYFDLPVERAAELIARKQGRSYTTLAADIQESDRTYQQQVREVYRQLAQSDSHWNQINCCHDDGSLRPIDDIANEVFQVTRALVPTPTPPS